MLGSLAEAQDVLAGRGVELDTTTIRTIAYRYAARARLACTQHSCKNYR
jgi:hypothetical protein